MGIPIKKVKEIVLIDQIAKRFKAKNKSVVVSIGDDAAVVRYTKDKYLLYTTDMLLEGLHFKKGEDLKKVGYKTMAASVSDIAAMGGLPKYALISVGLPKKNVEKLMQGLCDGIEQCAKKFDIDVIGGDMNRSRSLIIDVFMVGEVKRRHLVLRSKAKPGDHIFVSGPLGGSQRGRHLIFTPRIKESQFLVKNFKVTSMIDLSDGLALDLNRLAFASQLGALIFENRIPRSQGVSSTKAALNDGEDFELLFTLGRKDALKLLSMAEKKKTDFKFYQIGQMTDLFRGVKMMTRQGIVGHVMCDGFRHF